MSAHLDGLDHCLYNGFNGFDKSGGKFVAPIAIMKVGSTSTTLLVAETLGHPVTRHQRLFDLSRRDDQTALLSQAARWREEALAYGSEPLAAGGEKVRQNPWLENELRQTFPDWWSLNAHMEGRIAYLGVKAEDDLCDGVIDIGGGSTEIITSTHTWSFPVGAASPGRQFSWPQLSPLLHPVFVGGTAVALARWAKSFRVTRDTLETMLSNIKRDPQAFSEIDPLRLRLLPQGLSLMLSLAEHTGCDSLTISERGLSEGLWLVASLGRGCRPR